MSWNASSNFYITANKKIFHLFSSCMTVTRVGLWNQRLTRFFMSLCHPHVTTGQIVRIYPLVLTWHNQVWFLYLSGPSTASHAWCLHLVERVGPHMCVWRCTRPHHAFVNRLLDARRTVWTPRSWWHRRVAHDLPRGTTQEPRQRVGSTGSSVAYLSWFSTRWSRCVRPCSFNAGEALCVAVRLKINAHDVLDLLSDLMNLGFPR